MTRHPLYAIHGENSLNYAGWTVRTVEVGHDPTHTGGGDFRAIRDRGRVPIVRINNGYGDRGTIPRPEHYADFARRVANFVANSRGCNVWIVGNEPNTSWERPGGMPILPHNYAWCYTQCRAAIHALPGHADDLVLFAPVGPWNPETTYPGNERGDWLRYFRDAQRAADEIDGYALHAYAREQAPAAVHNPAPMTQPGWEGHDWGFHVYRDWMREILPAYRGRFVFVTEFDCNEPWQDADRGVIVQAYQEISAWNVAHPDQPIRGLAVYRWQYDRWTFKDKPQVIADFMHAVEDGLTYPPYSVPVEPEPPDAGDGLAALEARIDELDEAIERIDATLASVLDRMEAAGRVLVG